MDEESCRHQKTTLPHTPEDLLLFPAGMEKACQLWRLEKNLGPKIRYILLFTTRWRSVSVDKPTLRLCWCVLTQTD